MLKRARWFGLGAVVGALGSMYGVFRLRQAQQAVVDPDHLIDSVGQTLRTVGRAVRDAWDESRDAIDETESTMTKRYVDRRPRLHEVTED